MEGGRELTRPEEIVEAFWLPRLAGSARGNRRAEPESPRKTKARHTFLDAEKKCSSERRASRRLSASLGWFVS